MATKGAELRMPALEIRQGKNRRLYCFAVDGKILPHHPFDPTAPPESADVPIIISNTLEDAALRLTNFDLTEEGLRTMMNQRYGAKAEPMLAMYRAP